MNERFDDMIEKLKARMGTLNELIKHLAATGLLGDAVILGPIVHDRHVPPEVGGESFCQLAPAALLVSGGIGVIYWDLGEFSALKESRDDLSAAAWTGFLPFERCPGAEKGLLLPNIERLLEGLVKRLPRI